MATVRPRLRNRDGAPRPGRGSWFAISAAALVAATSAVCYPLAVEGYLNSQASPLYVQWAQQFLKSLYSGVPYPSWVAGSYADSGSAAFLFYPPFVFYASAVIGLFVDNVPTILSLYAALGMLASAGALYLLGRSRLGRGASLFAAVVFLALPYHLVDLYERAALSELWNFVWVPLGWYYIERLRENGVGAAVGLAVTYALMIVTHLPTALIATPVFCAAIGFQAVEARKWGPLLGGLLGLLAGICLSSAYLLPALVEQRHVNIGVMFGGWFDYANNFFFSRTAGDVDLNRRLTLMGCALLPAFFLPGVAWLGGWGRPDRFALFLCSIGLLSFLAMLPASAPLWELVPVFQKVQFPWRVLMIESLLAALCLGHAVERLLHPAESSARGAPAIRLAVGAVAALTLAGNLGMSCTRIKGFTPPSMQATGQLWHWRITAGMSYAELQREYNRLYPHPFMIDALEYRPIWAFGADGTELLPVPQRMILGAYGVFPDAEGAVTALRWAPEDRLLEVSSTAPGRLLVRLAYFPYWHAQVNSAPTPVSPDPETGLIAISVPEGRSEVALQFGPVPSRRLGAAVSAATLVAMLAALVAQRRRVRLSG